MKANRFILLLGLGCTLISSSAQTLVSRDEVWRYRKNGGALPAGWRTTADANLSASFLSGPGGFGYADNTAEVALVQTPLADMEDLYSTIAIRKSFAIAESVDPSLHLYLRVDFDDGFIAWLDGNFLSSFNSPGSPNEPVYNAVATANHESSRGDNTAQAARLVDLGAVGTRLGVGTHVLALMGLNVSLGSSDFVLIADLFLAPPPPDDCLSGTITGNVTWRSVDGAPISVCGDVTVAAGATLTIEAGTTVHLYDGVDILVASGGRLIAEGTAENRIRFMAAPLSERWGGIEILGAAGTPESRIAFADFSGNGDTAIHTDGASVYLDHLNFLTTDRQYVSLDASSFILSNCHFPKATTRFEPVHGSAGIRPGGQAIMRRNYFGGGLGYNDLIDFTGGNRPGPILHFVNNVVMGGDDDGLDLDGTDAWVEGNIFLKFHRNGNTPDSASAISGGSDSTRTSEVTIVNNIFFDCDNITTGKEGNFYTLMNNTIVRVTRTGGIDVDSGVVVLREVAGTPTAFARGAYLEHNIIWDVEKLARNYAAAQTTVVFNNNILPVAWPGPGAGNVIGDPLLVKIPTLEEANFTTWSEAQVLREWLTPGPNSPAMGKGALSIGASIHGDPRPVPQDPSARIGIGFNLSGAPFPAAGWPSGVGYSHYKWRLNSGEWSAETPIAELIEIPSQPAGTHLLEVSGKRDSGLYQDDPRFGEDAVVSGLSWTVEGSQEVSLAVSAVGNGRIGITFLARPNVTYVLHRKFAIDAAGAWDAPENYVMTAPAVGAETALTLEVAAEQAKAFYRVSAAEVPRQP